MHTDIPLHSPPPHFVTFPPRLLILLTSKSKSFSLHWGKLSSSYLQICVSYPAGAPQRLCTHLDPSSQKAGGLMRRHLFSWNTIFGVCSLCCLCNSDATVFLLSFNRPVTTVGGLTCMGRIFMEPLPCWQLGRSVACGQPWMFAQTFKPEFQWKDGLS